jgi:UDP-2,3-diacylglucosamine hydrolase
MLTIISGQGALPEQIVEGCKTRPIVASLEQFPPDSLKSDIIFRLETLGSFFQQLKTLGVNQVCFAGSIRRPKVKMELVDKMTVDLVPSLLQSMGQGDDSVLRTVIAAFEQNGFTIVGAQEILPELLPRAGIISKLVPTEADVLNIKRATDILRALEQLDVGQGCIVSNNQVLAIEAFGGTDWMLKSLSNRTDDWPYGGVLVKALKAGQDCRIDLPTVGPDTVVRAALAGLSGIAIQAGGVILLNPKSVRELADLHGIFVSIFEYTL